MELCALSCEAYDYYYNSPGAQSADWPPSGTTDDDHRRCWGCCENRDARYSTGLRYRIARGHLYGPRRTAPGAAGWNCMTNTIGCSGSVAPTRLVVHSYGTVGGFPGAVAAALTAFAARAASAARIATAARSDEQRNRVLEHLRRVRSVHVVQQSRLLPGHRSMRVLHEQGRQDGLRSRRAELPLPWRQC